MKDPANNNIATNKENISPGILVNFAYLGFISYTLWYSKKEKRFSMSFLAWSISIGGTLIRIFLFVQIVGYYPG